MEFVAFLLAIIFVSIGSFWVTGTLYGFFHRPAIYFPMSLATKMAASAVFGVWLFGIGGIVIATLVFNNAMMKRQDYSRWPAILAGSVISVVCSVIIYFAVFALAWGVLD